ncbi:MAG: GntR family transcriptional regulator [Anaerolineales bacterium]|nr:GntR family transcriptional regulator [Anaerolineales bacterium]
MTAKLALRLDFRSGLPIYIQIANQIQSLLTRGNVEIGEQLPTIRALAEELGVNFNTVARAYRILDKARVISTQQGRGTYITEKPSANTKDQLRHEILESLTQRFIAEAQQMGFSKQEILLVVKDDLKS